MSGRQPNGSDLGKTENLIRFPQVYNLHSTHAILRFTMYISAAKELRKKFRKLVKPAVQSLTKGMASEW